MELLQNILFINLEHRKDRLLSVTTQLGQMGLKGSRLNAIKHKHGAIGCSLSQIKCLQTAIENNWEQVCILEDDIVFTDQNLFLKNLERFHREFKEDWDVLFLSGNNAEPFFNVNDYLVKVNNCQCACAYIVKKHYYETLLNNWKEAVKKLMKDPDNKRMYACDMYWKCLQKRDNWYLLIPLTTHQLDDYSDIEKRVTTYKHMMLDLDKKKYFNNKYNA